MIMRSILTRRERWLTTLVLAITFIVGLAYTLTTGAEGNKEKAVTPFNDLLSQDERTRDGAVDKVLDDRKSVIDQFIPLIDPANAAKYRDETRCAAAYLLGELRAVEAVPVLSKALAKQPGRWISSNLSRYYDGPVVSALVKIGRPAIPAMIENIENSDIPEFRTHSLDVLFHVLGGKTRLLEVLAKVSDRAVKENRPPIISRRLAEAKSWAEKHYQSSPGSEEPLY